MKILVDTDLETVIIGDVPHSLGDARDTLRRLTKAVRVLEDGYHLNGDGEPRRSPTYRYASEVLDPNAPQSWRPGKPILDSSDR